MKEKTLGNEDNCERGEYDATGDKKRNKMTK